MTNLSKSFQLFGDSRFGWKCVLVCSLLIGVMMWILPMRSPFSRSDLAVYWTALRVVQNGGNPYDPHAMIAAYHRELGIETLEPGMMWNPPIFFVFPGAILNLPQPYVFDVLPVCSGAAALVLAMIGWRFSGPLLPMTTRTAVISVMSFPIFTQLYISQVSTLIALPVMLGSLLFLRRRDLLGGGLLSFALLKPHVFLLPLVALAFWTIIQRRWRLPIGVMIGLALNIGIVESLYPNLLLQWLYRPSWPLNIVGAALPTLIRDPLMQTLGYVPVFLEVLIPLCGAGVLLAYLWCYQRVPSGFGLVLAVALNMLFTPYGFVFDQSVGIVAQSFMLGQSRTREERTLAVRLILIANLIPSMCLVLLPSIFALWWMSYPFLLVLSLAFTVRRAAFIPQPYQAGAGS